MTALDDRLLPVFARQHWLVDSLRMCARRDGDASSASRRLQQGAGFGPTCPCTDWRCTGVVGSPGARSDARDRGPGDGLSLHRRGAARHPWLRPGHSGDLASRRGRAATNDLIVHTSTDLDRCRCVAIEGIPTTDVARTLLDLGRRVGDRRLLRAIEWSRREGTVDWPALIATLARHARVVALASDASDASSLRTSNETRSPTPTSSCSCLALLAEAGLPTPELHHRVHRRRAVRRRGRSRLSRACGSPSSSTASVHLAAGRPRARPPQAERPRARSAGPSSASPGERFADRPEQVVAEIRAAIARERGGLSHNLWPIAGASARTHHSSRLRCRPRTVSRWSAVPHTNVPQVAARDGRRRLRELAQPDRAWARSASRSSACSRPTDMRTRPSVMPSSARSAGV